MRFKKKAGNTFFTVIMLILASVATASLYYIIVSGYMSVSKDGVTASQYIKYRDYKGEPFEDTDLFNNELYGAINDITTLSNYIYRSLLSLRICFSQIFSHDSHAKKLNTTNHKNYTNHTRPSTNWIPK